MNARLAAAAAVALLVAAPSCDADRNAVAEPGVAAGPDPAAVAAATVRVRADGCGPRIELGTGTAIADGLVVTAAHVVAGADRVEVVDRFGTTLPADVVWFDPGVDVAALRPSTEFTSSVELRDEVGREGERGVVAIISSDGAREPLVVEVLQRVTMRTTDIYGEERVERSGLRIDVDVEPGDSGAMVHLPGGGVGIVWSRSTSDDDRAWTVDLPTELFDASTRRSFVEPVDVGRCI